MSLDIIRQICFASFVSGMVAMALAGRPTLQAATLLIAFILAVVTVWGLRRIPDGSTLGFVLSVAMALTLTIAAWNFLGHPSERWAHRTFIYTVYSAAAAIMLLATVLDQPDEVTRPHWYAIAGIYLAATVSIALLKPCFAQRMLEAAAI